MTQKEFDERNAKGFEGDEYLAADIANICKVKEVDLIIETGTYRGFTTQRLAELAETYTVELNEEFFKESKKNIGDNPKITQFLGNTVDFLKEQLPKLKDKKLLFFLDAHFYNQPCPLLHELAVIAENKIKPIIAIHDFLNPSHLDYGYDIYNGQPFTWEWIKPSIEKIYGENYSFHYNDKATGAKRGVIFIQPSAKHTPHTK